MAIFRLNYLNQVQIAANTLSRNRAKSIIQRFPRYLGVQKRPEIASNEHFSKIDFRINRRPSSLPRVSDNAIDWERYIENRKSAVRCKVEHAFRIIKCQFGYKKTVYRGLKKNENRLYAMFACANLYALAMAGRKLSAT